MSKCSECKAEAAGKVRYVRTVVVKPAGGKPGDKRRYGSIAFAVGECYIGDTVRVVVERKE